MHVLPCTHSIVDEVVQRHLARLHLGEATSGRPRAENYTPRLPNIPAKDFESYTMGYMSTWIQRKQDYDTYIFGQDLSAELRQRWQAVLLVDLSDPTKTYEVEDFAREQYEKDILQVQNTRDEILRNKKFDVLFKDQQAGRRLTHAEHQRKSYNAARNRELETPEEKEQRLKQTEDYAQFMAERKRVRDRGYSDAKAELAALRVLSAKSIGLETSMSEKELQRAARLMYKEKQQQQEGTRKMREQKTQEERAAAAAERKKLQDQKSQEFEEKKRQRREEKEKQREEKLVLMSAGRQAELKKKRAKHEARKLIELQKARLQVQDLPKRGMPREVGKFYRNINLYGRPDGQIAVWLPGGKLKVLGPEIPLPDKEERLRSLLLEADMDEEFWSTPEAQALVDDATAGEDEDLGLDMDDEDLLLEFFE